jgi:hypothetical protein
MASSGRWTRRRSPLFLQTATLLLAFNITFHKDIMRISTRTSLTPTLASAPCMNIPSHAAWMPADCRQAVVLVASVDETSHDIDKIFHLWSLVPTSRQSPRSNVSGRSYASASRVDRARPSCIDTGDEQPAQNNPPQH